LKIYGQRYNEKRQVTSFTLTYAKPKDVFAALESLKSEIGRVIVDESSGTVILMDTPERVELMRQKTTEIDRPKDTEIFDLQYAKAADLSKQVASSLTEGVGELRVDERTNRIMVSDLPDKMKKIKQMVKAFDREHNEVFIEGEIVQITLNKQFQRGINWEAVVRGLHNLDFKGAFPVSSTLSAYQQISIGTLATDDYNTVLQLLQTYGDTKVVSRPRIAAIDNQEAKIMVGVRQAYSTNTVSQGSTSTTVTAENVEFIDVGVKLSVTPQVNKDGFVTMKIKPEVSFIQDFYPTSSGNKIPNVATSQAETVVKVKDGSMIMIAGLMKEEKSDDRQEVPFISKIPLLGAIFSNKATQNKKTELIIFITPHIMTGEASYIGTQGERVPQIPKTATSFEKINDRLKGVKEDYEQ
jgi:type II secretory pathway component GspD/PulD (secretin)